MLHRIKNSHFTQENVDKYCQFLIMINPNAGWAYKVLLYILEKYTYGKNTFYLRNKRR